MEKTCENCKHYELQAHYPPCDGCYVPGRVDERPDWKPRDDLRAEADRLAEEPQNVCVWTENADGYWEADCGYAFCLSPDGSPSGHRMYFCPHCGKKLREERNVLED